MSNDGRDHFLPRVGGWQRNEVIFWGCQYSVVYGSKVMWGVGREWWEVGCKDEERRVEWVSCHNIPRTRPHQSSVLHHKYCNTLSMLINSDCFLILRYIKIKEQCSTITALINSCLLMKSSEPGNTTVCHVISGVDWVIMLLVMNWGIWWSGEENRAGAESCGGGTLARDHTPQHSPPRGALPSRSEHCLASDEIIETTVSSDLSIL